jgi:phosphoribosylamine---glycine ligase
MNILLIGSGGREHALAWKLAQSPNVTGLFIAPGNAGTRNLGTNVPLKAGDFASIREFVLGKKISMVVVGPEDPLVNGIHDYFLADEQLRTVPVIGPEKSAARLEGSKEFAKQFMVRNGIPTAAYKTFSLETLPDGIDFIKHSKPPYVLKADGLAAGKGVVICPNREEAINELFAMLRDAKFGEASRHVVIEEFLEGIEMSAFVLTDGKSYLILPEAKDYKKIGEGDTGPNTGGMGSLSPVPFAAGDFMQKVEERVIKPTIEGLKKEGIRYKGFIFFGLMSVNGDPFVIEYNCRMGDPEAESVIPRIQNDLAEIFLAVGEERLSGGTVQIDPRNIATVMLVSGGYPGDYAKGKVITLPEGETESIIFHAGTTTDLSGNIVTSGGRVFAVTSYGDSLKDALEKSYRTADTIVFDGKYYRTDIGFEF